MELKLKRIIEGLNHSSGQKFFEKIVLNLASAIDLKYVFIARLDASKQTSTTIALGVDGKIVDNIEYDLKDTPCEDVSQNIIVCIPNNITALYPNDKLLSDMNIEAYIGAPLNNSDGEVFGIVVALSEKEIKNQDVVTTLFKVFSGRIAVELEREALEISNRKYIERYELAFLGSNDGLWDWNIEEDSVYLSPRWKEMLGYSDDEIDNCFESWQSRIHPDDLEEALQNVENCINNKIPVYENYHRLKHKNGSWVWIFGRARMKFDENGKAIRFSGTHTDVTREKNLEQELIELNASLERKVEEKVKELEIKNQQMFHQSRLAQMGEMISMIAHQWRQPLGAIAVTSIDLKIQIELEKYNLEEKNDREAYKKYFINGLRTIENLTQNLTTIIDDFRDFYKPNKVYKPVDINETIQKALNIVRGSLVTSNIALVEDYSSGKEIQIIESEVMHVILNIMKNALDNFKTEVASKATIWINTIDTDDGVTVTICDNGGGIAQEIMYKIFDPYFSTKQDKNGTGLGLYLSKIIIEEHHDGILEVSNERGGACFKLIF